MVIRKVESQDFEEMAELYSKFFATHDIFTQKVDTILSYLQNHATEHECFISKDEHTLLAVTFVVKLGESKDGSHKRWRLRHFAFRDDTAAIALLGAVEKYLTEQSKTVKIEQNLAENEKGLEFYVANGFVQEGVLMNHYRFGERCIVLGKTLP